MPSKFSAHFQGMDNAVASLINTDYVKVMDPPEQNPFPQSKVIARFHMEDGAKEGLVHMGAAGAVEWFNFLKPKMDKRPWVYAVEAPNEPLAGDLFNPHWCDVLTEFTIKFLELGHAAGWRMVVGNFSVGQPPFSTWLKFIRFIKKMKPGDMLGLHEYGAPNMWDNDNGHLTLRYRIVKEKFDKWGYEMPPVFIGECGIDGLLLGTVPKGWIDYRPQHIGMDDWRRMYFQQLVWYDEETMKDDYVIAFCPYTAAPENTWRSYKIDDTLQAMIYNRVNRLRGQKKIEGEEHLIVSDAKIDPRIKDYITVVDEGTKYKLVKVDWADPQQAGGKHSIYIDVLDLNGNRAVGTEVCHSWNGGNSCTRMEEKPGEPSGANFGMYAGLGSYTVWVGGASESDVVRGFGLGTPETPDVSLHTAFYVVFQEVSPEAPTPEPPTPEPPVEPPVEPPPVTPPSDIRETLEQAEQDAMSALVHIRAALEELDGDS